ncbi:MAG: sulfatase [Verrucomicrobia bacterium]|nr:sulfatase [Verrucomicrobiota bacterium]
MKRHLIAVLAFFVLASATHAAAPPNILFILTDDQGWCMMSERMHPDIPESRIADLRTPAMDRLAREGMRFTSGYSPGPLCTPTRRSIVNGMTPARQRGTEFKSTWVPADHLTIPRALKQVNPAYACAHFGKWGEDMISTPEQCGYDASDGLTVNNTGSPGGLGDTRFTDAVREDPKLITTLTKRAVEFMGAQVKAQRPFYLQLSHYAVHRQVQASPATNEKYVKGPKPTRQFTPTFAAMMEDLNAGLTQLLDEVDRLGIAGNTYIVFTADNGGYATYANTDTSLPSNNHPLRAQKQYLYEGGIRVPFIVRGPGVKAGSVSHEPVTGYDLLPTFFDLAGGKAALPSDLDGGSFRAVLENAGAGKVKRALPGIVHHRPNFAALPVSTFRMGDLKLMVNNKTGDQELFDLAKDIGETKNVAATMPEKVTEMSGILAGYLKSVNAETYNAAPAAKKKKAKTKKADAK